MTHDLLDDHLDRSAPPTDRVAQTDLDAMIADARPRSRRPLRARVAVAAGLTVLIASGGAGLAAATDGFTWAPWAQDPIGSVQFRMANGYQCELRYTGFRDGTDPAYIDEINGILEEWHRSADVVAAARPLVPAQLEALGPIELQPGETLETLPPGEAERREFNRQWFAWDLAVSTAEWQELERHGIQPGDARGAGSERNSQINCLDENHEPYTFGAGE